MATVQVRVDVGTVCPDQVIKGEREAFDQHPVGPAHLQVDPGIGRQLVHIGLDGLKETITETLPCCICSRRLRTTLPAKCSRIV